MKHSLTLRRLTEGAMIAAVYAVLTFLLWTFSSMQIQVRVSEALCILPLFTPAAVPGLSVRMGKAPAQVATRQKNHARPHAHRRPLRAQPAVCEPCCATSSAAMV